MRERVERRIDRRVRLEVGAGYHRAVGFDSHAVDRACPLRDSAFERGADGELRCGGQLRQATQHERGGRSGITMRQAADRGCHPGHEN